MPAPTRRSARTAIHDDEDCIVRETDDDDGDIKSDTDIVSASGDDNDAPSSSTAPAVRRRASRVKKEAEEQVAPVPLTRRNQPKRGVSGGALPVEPKVERTFEKPKQRRPRPSKHQVLDDNDSSDFVKDDVKTLRPPPFQASTSSSIPRLTADGGDIMSDDNRPEAAKLGKQGRPKRVVRAIPVRRPPTTLKPLSKNAQGKRKAAAHIECTLLNNDVGKPLHGFDALDRDDVDRVQAYMVTNSKLGVEDERVALGDEAFIKRDILPAGTPSPHLTASLLPYQQEGLAWMKAQEASKYRGGILADEMGMGKTIQAIATMLENVKIKQFHGMVMGGGTLIICPVIACMQ
ncbi:hypothetical protein DYB26_004193, partial [Aphanomyces astaci]